jgi:DNA polymerase III delta subunit
MIVYQFRNLLRVKSLTNPTAGGVVPYAEIIKKTGLNPYVVKKTYEQCKKYELAELKNIFSGLAALDIETKSGRLDLGDGLYQLTFSL